MFPEYHLHEVGTIKEHQLWNALKFGTAGEVNSKEGAALVEGFDHAPPNCNEVGAPQGELDGANGEAPILQPDLQCPRTKQIFDVHFDDQFLD